MVHGNVEAFQKDGVTHLRCDVCEATRPLDVRAWVDSINAFAQQHYHADPLPRDP
ncbi:MAG: hypothetical protein QOJ26_1671 [Thermoplasmata archaeon]|jgi:hypothetical protein|nr:hypothetical protein [Thermoplasmata archaeon]MEA3166797.1 hypothetical protein [Thermoplasmata archaeon]